MDDPEESNAQHSTYSFEVFDVITKCFKGSSWHPQNAGHVFCTSADPWRQNMCHTLTDVEIEIDTMPCA